VITLDKDIESLSKACSISMVRKNNARMGVIHLIDGKVCLYSPLATVPQSVFEQYTVSHLLAPNHYHNKAMRSYAEYFPKAKPCASKAAQARLKTQTNLAFRPIKTLADKLPTNLQIIEPMGLKTGEVWIKFLHNKQCGWFVVDAFCGSKMTKSVDTCSHPELLKTFPNYGIADLDMYKSWLLAQIKIDKPKIIIPCHGSIVRNTRLPTLLKKLAVTI